MDRLNNANTLDILKYIIRHDKVKRDTFTILITGRVGPTGKTWLCNELCKIGYKAMEMSPLFHSLRMKDDGVNHVVVDDSVDQVIVVLNEILPMYCGKGFKFHAPNPEDSIYIFQTRADAENALCKLERIAEAYGCTTRKDFNDMINMISLEEDFRYGWVDGVIQKARVRSHSLGYFIEFPKATPIM
jgi:hypothetical protein